MTRAHPDAPATWYRLSEESWAEIREAYRNGATARELAARWRVSPGSIYRHACAGGWSKKASADALARAHAAQIAAEEAADEAALTRAAPEPVDATPSAMRARAMRELSGALAAGRYREAQVLARLVRSLGELASEADGEQETEHVAPPLGGERNERAQMDYLAKKLAELKAEAMWPQIKLFAEQMLADRTYPPAILSRAFLRWRAEHLGPAQAEADRQAVVGTHYYDRLYDAEGQVRQGWGSMTDDLPKPDGADAFKAELRAAQARLEARDEEGA
ncbi:MAG: hypothetical protein ACM3W4_05705 [Ignavibacteriales bacterium]